MALRAGPDTAACWKATCRPSVCSTSTRWWGCASEALTLKPGATTAGFFGLYLADPEASSPSDLERIGAVPALPEASPLAAPKALATGDRHHRH